MRPLTVLPSRQRMDRLPRAVVEVRVPRRPGAVEGKGQLLVVLVLLTPHPKGLEHFLHDTLHKNGEKTYSHSEGAAGFLSKSLDMLPDSALHPTKTPTPLWRCGAEAQTRSRCSSDLCACAATLQHRELQVLPQLGARWGLSPVLLADPRPHRTQLPPGASCPY